MKKHNPKSCVAIVPHEDGSKAFAEIKVFVCPGQAGGYVAHGIDVDYVAAGPTADAARDRFIRGFQMTLECMLEDGHDVSTLFKSSTPPDIVASFWETSSPDRVSWKVGPVAVKSKQQPVDAELRFYRSSALAA